MADWAPNHTHRYRMRYRVTGQPHTMMMRTGRGVFVPDAAAAPMGAFLTALAPVLGIDFTILGADAAAADSDIFLPTTMPEPDPAEGPVGDQSTRPLFLSFVGRSEGGARVIITVYGFTTSPTSGTNPENDYLLTAAESAPVAAAYTALEASAALTGIDGTPIRWYPYANIGFNSYYQRKQRRG